MARPRPLHRPEDPLQRETGFTQAQREALLKLAQAPRATTCHPIGDYLGGRSAEGLIRRRLAERQLDPSWPREAWRWLIHPTESGRRAAALLARNDRSPEENEALRRLARFQSVVRPARRARPGRPTRRRAPMAPRLPDPPPPADEDRP